MGLHFEVFDQGQLTGRYSRHIDTLAATLAIRWGATAARQQTAAAVVPVIIVALPALAACPAAAVVEAHLGLMVHNIMVVPAALANAS